MSNLQKLRDLMSSQGVPALLVTDIINVRWLTGFTGSYGLALVTQADSVFITDSRYTIQAGNEISELPVVSFSRPQTIEKLIAEYANRMGAAEVAFETSASFATVEKKRADIPAVSWVAAPDLITELRKIKSADEIRRIQAACQLADACLEHAFRLLQPGVKEYDVSLDIEFFYRRHGAGIAFAPIVVSGPNSAKPHGMPGERTLQDGDFVTIDCGGKLDGYCSDITRTFVIGKASDRHKEIYNQVLRAEVECCAALLVGADGQNVDALARDILNEKDLGKYFGHGLGHGLGIDVHDPGRLSPGASEPIKAGMVFTVEPGVYIEGFGGVRIEDDVHVTENGPVILTHYPKELIEIS